MRRRGRWARVEVSGGSVGYRIRFAAGSVARRRRSSTEYSMCSSYDVGSQQLHRADPVPRDSMSETFLGTADADALSSCRNACTDGRECAGSMVRTYVSVGIELRAVSYERARKRQCWCGAPPADGVQSQALRIQRIGREKEQTETVRPCHPRRSQDLLLRCGFDWAHWKTPCSLLMDGDGERGMGGEKGGPCGTFGPSSWGRQPASRHMAVSFFSLRLRLVGGMYRAAAERDRAE